MSFGIFDLIIVPNASHEVRWTMSLEVQTSVNDVVFGVRIKGRQDTRVYKKKELVCANEVDTSLRSIVSDIG